MAEALVAGMLTSGLAKPEQLYAADILPERRPTFRPNMASGLGQIMKRLQPMAT